ncbi:hypothetical protein P7C70_g1388, partial [Phenoliferia sp. Uapishka_3]
MRTPVVLLLLAVQVWNYPEGAIRGSSLSSKASVAVSRESEGDLYSGHNCVGRDPGGDATRCRFRNVCLELKERLPTYTTNPPTAQSVKLSYFRPIEARAAPLYWWGWWNAKTSWARIGADSPLIPEIRLEPIPQDALWSPAETTVLTESWWPENFAHALGDDYLPVYRLAKSFGLWDRTDVSVIFHPDCQVRGDSERGCHHHAEIAPLLLDRPIETIHTPMWTLTQTEVSFGLHKSFKISE